uniref:TRP C-terminal domain-containing protein n=1 Tax=Amphimedon queenslandica TaxID=400682 RepID=A0A1X7V9V8_AMPQE
MTIHSVILIGCLILLEDMSNCTVAHHNCPFDYCVRSTVYLSLNESDLQCSSGRSGILCGKCNPGLSLVLGSNKCQSCSNKYISIVIAFIVAGICLLLFLLVCNLTVSVGSINGLLFFANIVKLNEVVLFPDGVRIPVLSQFIAWLNLDLGVQICFFSGLDGYWKTWLQFGFSLILIATILLCCRFSSKLSRLFGTKIVSVLSTLILMAHSKLLLSMADDVLRFKPFIDPYTGPYKNRFRYWTGLLLIVRLLLTTIFSYTTGTIPQVNNYIIGITAFITLFLSRGVYLDKRLNLLEYFYLLNLASLSLINALLHHMAIGHHRKYSCCNTVQNSEEEKTLLKENEDHCHEEEMFSPALIIN